MQSWDQLLQSIEEADIITIFRHTHPDCDAVGSQFGMKEWLRYWWPDKQVYALGAESCSQGHWPESDQADDETVRKSLAIVLDTANVPRIDDERSMSASKVIKIDHHPDRDPYGDVRYVFETSAATCEILTQMMCDTGKMPDDLCAKYLYSGLLTDTLCFRTSNTTAHTLKMASVLAEFNVPIPELNRELFDRSMHEFRFACEVRSRLQINAAGTVGIVRLDPETLAEYGLTPSEGRNYIDEIGHIHELEIWCIFTVHPEHPELWNGSLRSKTVPVNDIAEHFGGGGHKNASGVKDLTDSALQELIHQLYQRAEKR